jgi:putative ubiquitin-RnfH superfamily antitoxin RatB of RatAB toxin-antitoxin module
MNNTEALPIALDVITITVVTTYEEKLWQRTVTLPCGATLEESLHASGFFNDFPKRSIPELRIGVFGKHLPLHHLLHDQDRVEIYAPLRVDPKIARRRRAAHREKTRHIKKKMPVNDLTQS